MGASIIIAVVSACVSIVSIVLSAEAGRRTVRLQDALVRERERTARDESLATIVATYREPLITAAFDLQSRLFTIACAEYLARAHARGPAERRYARTNTMFLLAQFLGWVEAVRVDVQRLDPAGADTSRDLAELLGLARQAMAADEPEDGALRITWGAQRAMGELMLSADDRGPLPGPRRCIGFAEFTRRLRDDDFGPWFEPLGDEIEAAGHDAPPGRAARVQSALVDLIVYLDEGAGRFPAEHLSRAVDVLAARGTGPTPAARAAGLDPLAPSSPAPTVPPRPTRPDVDLEGLVLWTGAGVSSDGPTGGPLGRRLTDRALESYFAPGVRSTLERLYADLDAPHAAMRPRLETVLDALTDVFGLPGLEDVISDLADAPPNRHHRRLHRFAAAGARVVTANFDTCIERAGASSVEVAHIHGAIGPGRNIAALGARISVIEGGFSKAVDDALRAYLARQPVTHLVFLGYSGSDYFDATPFLLSWLATAGPVDVTWHVYERGPLTFGPVPEDATGLLAEIVAAGHDVTIARGTLDDLFATFAPDIVMGAPDEGPSPVPVRSRWWPAVARPDQRRRAASVALFTRLGYRKGVLDYFSAEAPRTRSEWLGLADACWGAGEYRRAREAWATVYRDREPLRWAEREGAYKWITGRFLGAERLLWRTIQTHGATEGLDLSAWAAVLRTYGRVSTQMDRTELRFLAAIWKTRRSAVSGRIDALLSCTSADLSPEERVELTNVGNALSGRTDPAFSTHVAGFEERERISSWLNYRHGHLRARYADGSSRPKAHEYREQARREAVLGARADRMRAMLIPGAPAHFGVGEFVSALAPVEMCLWHRLRSLGLFLAMRARGSVAVRLGSRAQAPADSVNRPHEADHPPHGASVSRQTPAGTSHGPARRG